LAVASTLATVKPAAVWVVRVIVSLKKMPTTERLTEAAIMLLWVWLEVEIRKN